MDGGLVSRMRTTPKEGVTMFVPCGAVHQGAGGAGRRSRRRRRGGGGRGAQQGTALQCGAVSGQGSSRTATAYARLPRSRRVSTGAVARP
eukprot:3665465-Prymnesium_polylepis.2